MNENKITDYLLMQFSKYIIIGGHFIVFLREQTFLYTK